MAKEVFGKSQEELEQDIASEIKKNEVITADIITKAVAKVIFENNKVITEDVYQARQDFLDGFEQEVKRYGNNL